MVTETRFVCAPPRQGHQPISYVPYLLQLLQLLTSELVGSKVITLVATLDIALEPAQHIVFEGVSSNIPLTKLAEGESYEVEVPITFVSLGHFDLSAQVRRLGHAVGVVGRGQLSAIVQELTP